MPTASWPPILVLQGRPPQRDGVCMRSGGCSLFPSAPHQVVRYKELLVKQRDIMIALTAKLHERDAAILALQARHPTNMDYPPTRWP